MFPNNDPSNDPEIIDKISVNDHVIIFNCQTGEFEITGTNDQEVWVLEDTMPSVSAPTIWIDDDGTLLDEDFVLVD